MRLTLEDILKEVGGYVDQDASTPTGTDLTVRTSYANRALQKWAKSLDWDELTRPYEFNIAAASTVSLALPTNFKKPMSGLYHYENSSAAPTEYEIIPREDRFGIVASTENVAYIDGNAARGYYLIVPKGLPSGASVMMDIQSFPSSFVTLTDYAEIPDPEYITTETIGYVLEARSDARFPYAKEDAKVLLANMIENQHAKNKGMKNQIPTANTFRIGRD